MNKDLTFNLLFEFAKWASNILSGIKRKHGSTNLTKHEITLVYAVYLSTHYYYYF